MKLKEISRTAIQSWSPAQHHPIYLATGTSAQQLDASFSTSASLEIFELDLADPSLDMKSCGTFSSTHRYHKLVWGPHGMDASGCPSGILIAGSENGDVILYDPAKIIAGDGDVIIAQSDKHTGPVRALDVNPFQANLVASGGNQSEIYIWDMNNFGSPMTPGPKTQPPEDISCVAWNRQVQHILASASPSGRASVWDLRKNDLIIKVSDHSNRMHCSGLAWNPEVATQLVLASEDDRLPVIQMWDLRFATSPLKILENHTRGVLAIAWSMDDPELLLSCGKDSRILCWNPNTGEVVYELPDSTQWCFDIQWCPRNPAVLSAAAFDGHIGIYSIMGGNNQGPNQRHVDQITYSFGNMDPFGTGQTLPPLQLPQTTTASLASINPLKKPPKWIRRPVGASFAFGGKLVSLENTKPCPQQPQQPTTHVVHVSQVVTENTFLKRSDKLQATLNEGNFVDFCQVKINATESQFEKTVWSFLKVNFDNDVRGKYLELLGFKKEEVALKISTVLEKKVHPVEPVDLTAPVNPAQTSVDSRLPESAEDSPEVLFDLISAANQLPDSPELEATSDPVCDNPAAFFPEDDSPVEDGEPEEPKQNADQAPLEEEEEVPLDEEVTPHVEVEASPIEETPVPLKRTAVLPVSLPASIPDKEAVSLSISQDVDGLIMQALLTGDFEGAVELCLHDNRMADSIILAIAGGGELLEKTQKKYFTKTHSKITMLISAVVMKDWKDVLQTCDLQNWKEALAAVMTYAQPEEFSSLCDLLGGRLDASLDSQLQAQACLCYICAGNVEKLVSCWTRSKECYCPLSLQDLVEKVVVLRRAVEQTQHLDPAVMGVLLAERMSQYASLLASQGSLATALNYLPDNTNQVVVQQLRERLSQALGQQTVTSAAPGLTQSALTQPPSHQSHHAAAMPRHPFTSTQPAMVPQPTPVPMSTPTPAQPQYYQPMRATTTVTSWSNQTPTALPNAPPPPPPPPPPQIGSASDQQAEPSTPMYGMLTSGTNAAPPASSTSTYMVSHQYQPYIQVSQYPPEAVPAPFYQPVHYSSSPLPPAVSSTVPQPPGFLSQYTQPADPLYPRPPPLSQPLSSSPPSFQPYFPPDSSSFSLSSGTSFHHGGPGSPVSYMPPSPGGASGPQNGWNDPPALSRAAKKKQVPLNYTPPAPITTPIMAPLGGEPPAQPGSAVPPQNIMQCQPGVHAPYSGMLQQAPLPNMNPAMPQTNVEGAPGAPTGDIIQPMQSISAEKIQKKPIPDEHLVLKTTFEVLIQKCLTVANDPQTRRKLDDASKRLEALYDKLREQTLSPAIVGGLHNMARSIETRSYIEGLNIHTHIVSNSNFSETSAFMPVLKVVLTQANKLGV